MPKSTPPSQTPESLGQRLLYILFRDDDCPQDEALALIAAGADVAVKNGHDSTALHYAAWDGYTDIVLALLERGAQVDAKNKSGDTALHQVRGNTAIAIALIENGADVSAKNDEGYTPLHLAAANGRADIVAVFLEKGADICVKDGNGHTAETLARKYGHIDIAERIRAAHLKRATKAFRTGLKDEMPAPPPLRVKRRSPVP